MRGVAWAAPTAAVLVAAPALAMSCSQPVAYTAPLNTANYKRTNNKSGTGTARSTVTGSAAITYTISSVASAGQTLVSNNLSVAGDINNGYNGAGSLTTDGLQLQQSGATTGQTVSITFSRPVTNLSVMVADIDRTSSTHADIVSFSPAPSTVTNGRGVQGAGTASSPLTAKAVGEVTSDTVANRSTVTFAGPLTTLTVRFGSSVGTASQQVFLAGLSFSATPC